MNYPAILALVPFVVLLTLFIEHKIPRDFFKFIFFDTPGGLILALALAIWGLGQL